MPITDDPNNPGLRKVGPDGMQESYLVLSDEERAKGFVRPVRRSYQHVGRPAPKNPLRDLTTDERARYDQYGYVQFETYPDPKGATGRFWTQAELDRVGKGCGTVTTMGVALAETYARDPKFYGGTYCVGCRDHFPVGENGEFVWVVGGSPTQAKVGT